MLVRTVKPEEILPALHLVWEVYASDLAPLQSPEAVAGFQDLIRYPNIEPRIRRGEITLFGAWEGDDLRGVSGIDRSGEILLFYVRKEYQRQKTGRQLMQAMYMFCAQVLVITRITIKAPPSSAAAMNYLGFRETAPAVQTGSSVYVPMELMIAPAAMPAGKAGKQKKRTVAAVIALILALILLLAAMAYREARNVYGGSGDSSYGNGSYGSESPYDDESPYDGGQDGSEGADDFGEWFGGDDDGGYSMPEEDDSSGIDLLGY